MAQKVKIVQNVDDEVPMEVLATSIRDLAALGRKIEESPLNRKCVVVLLQEVTKLRRDYIELILNALPDLENQFLKKKKVKS